MRSILLWAAWLVAVLPLSAYRAEFHPGEMLVGRIVHVSDGDTVRLRLTDGRDVPVRLYGIDAPELDQPFGPEATRRLVELVHRMDVSVRVVRIGRYNRVVGEIFRSDMEESLNWRMVREGWAWHYVQFARNDRLLARAEATARRERRGLWADGESPLPPWEWRRR